MSNHQKMLHRMETTVTATTELVATDGREALITRLHHRRLALINFMLAEVAGDDDPGAPGQGHINMLAAVEVVLDVLQKELK